MTGTPTSSNDDSTLAIGLRLREYATHELHRAIVCLGWRGPRLHAGVHQARKSLRRVRATLELAGIELGNDRERIDRRLRRLNRSLAELRDAQALVEVLDRLLRLRHRAHTRALLARARRAAQRHRAAQARRHRYRDIDFARVRARLQALLPALTALAWERVDEAAVRASLRRALEAADSAAAQALPGHDALAWHGWRRRLRRQSQQWRALREHPALLPEDAAQRRTLAVALGEAQDLELLRTHCGAGSPFSRSDAPALARLATSGLHRRRVELRSLNQYNIGPD